MGGDVRDRLQGYCEGAFPAWRDVRVGEVVSVNEGWESDIYSFELTHGPDGVREREGLILRIYPGDDAVQKSAREFRGMRQLHRAGYPVPEVLVLERERSPFGKPFVIMERIEGRMLWPVMFGPSWTGGPLSTRTNRRATATPTPSWIGGWISFAVSRPVSLCPVSRPS